MSGISTEQASQIRFWAVPGYNAKGCPHDEVVAKVPRGALDVMLDRCSLRSVARILASYHSLGFSRTVRSLFHILLLQANIADVQEP